MSDVFLHVGLPKTGTTTVQAVLEQRASALAEVGVLFPGGRHHAERLAAYDLLGQRVRGDDNLAVAGAFARLVAEVGPFQGRSVVVSEEELGLARPRHVRRVVRSLPGHRVVVVVTVRDLARTLVSAWQQSVVMGSTVTWEQFVDAAQDPAQGPSGLSFWVRHDLLRVLDAWGSELPVEQVRIVTVPPSGETTVPGVTGARGDTLLDRFAAATELPAGALGDPPAWRNVSLGAAELEVLRRLNERLVGPLNTKQYRHVVEQGLRSGLESTRSRAPQLRPEHVAWVRGRSADLVAELERRGHPVVGDLADLLPADAPLAASHADGTSESELLAAAEAGLASLALAHGRLFTRYNRAFRREEGRLPTPRELVGSSSRAAVFHLQKQGLAATGHPLVNWAARTWLRRTSGTR